MRADDRDLSAGEAAEAYQRMLSGKARFRVVLVPCQALGVIPAGDHSAGAACVPCACGFAANLRTTT